MELIINTFGATLTKEGENFLVVHPDGKQRIHPQKIKSILISKGAAITSDAALLAIQNEIDVLFIDQTGKPAGRLWSVKFGSVSTIRRKQVDFTFSKQAIEWIKEITIQKIDNQIALLLALQPDHLPEKNAIAKAITRLDDYRNKIKKLQADVISDLSPTLRGWEGVSAKIYFEALNLLLPSSYKFEARSKHPATDVFNCLLNYGYGMLYGKVEGALIKAGIDPYVGVFHREDYNRPVLVFDVIEIFRIWVDYVVFHLLQQQVINEDCYSIKPDGSYWLEGLGKRILIQSLNDYLGEIINMNKLERSRETHIELYAQQLAQKFLNFKND